MHQSTLLERRTFWACLGGWSLDALDVQMFSLVIPALIASWHVSNTEAGLVSSVTLFASALGGWLGGALSDRFGRVRALQITILWFALATFVSAFTQSFEQLLVIKGLQGLGFGAEWAAGAVLLAEVVRPEHRGKALGTLQSGWAIGWGASVLLYTTTFSLLPSDIAWRVMFAFGLLPALLVLYLRRSLPEPARGPSAPQRLGGRPGADQHFPARDAENHAGRYSLRPRRPRGLLRSCHMAADLSQDGASSVRHGHWFLSRRHHRRIWVRLPRCRPAS